ncbi:MAG: HD-GYP domain-containing protein [Bacillota bacterium]
MRLISLRKVASGMVLARDIYSCDGNILLAKGVVLTQHFLNRLNHLGIQELYIEDSISKDIEVHDVINQETRILAKKMIFQAMSDIRQKKKFSVSGISDAINRIVDELLSSKNLMVNLTDLRCVDEYTFAHSVNVAILSILIGKSLGYNELRLRDLGIGAMLHDIGKTQIPTSILNKPGPLLHEEFELMKKHTLYGFSILREYDDISSLSRIIALMHHERIDGTGYPLGKCNTEIHEFAKIVSVTDTYDALTSSRVYKEKITPDKAVEYLLSTSDVHYDQNIVNNLLNHIVVFPLGTLVQLNTVQKAIVIDNNRNYPTRPVVRIVFEDDGKYIDGQEEIDLQKNPDIYIIEVCDN